MLSIPAQLKCTRCPNTASISLRFAEWTKLTLRGTRISIELDSIPTTLSLLEFDLPEGWSKDWHSTIDAPLCPACALLHGGPR